MRSEAGSGPALDSVVRFADLALVHAGPEVVLADQAREQDREAAERERQTSSDVVVWMTVVSQTASPICATAVMTCECFP